MARSVAVVGWLALLASAAACNSDDQPADIGTTTEGSTPCAETESDECLCPEGSHLCGGGSGADFFDCCADPTTTSDPTTGGSSTEGETTGGSSCLVEVCATRVPADLSFFVGNDLLEIPDGRLAFWDFDSGTSTSLVGLTDGTEDGTVYVDTGLQYNPHGVTLVSQGRLISAWAPEFIGDELYVFRSTDPVTGESVILSPEDEVAVPDQLRGAVDGLVFRTMEGLYVSDGTPAGTVRLFETEPGVSTLQASQLYAFGDRVAFIISEQGGGATVYSSSGAGSPEALGTIDSAAFVSPRVAQRTATMPNGELWFHRMMSNQVHEVWRVGAGAPLSLVGAPSVIQTSDAGPFDWTVSGTDLYFTSSPSNAAVPGRRPYVSDGTDAGTIEVWAPDAREFFTEGSNGSGTLIPDGLGGLWFRASKPNDSQRVWLWRMSGTESTPLDLQSLAPGPEVANEQQFGAGYPVHVLGGRTYAPGHPYVVEIGDDGSVRRIGAAENPGSTLADVHVVTHTADRVWFGDSTGLYYIPRE